MNKILVENFKPLRGRMWAALTPKTALSDSPTLTYEFSIELEPIDLGSKDPPDLLETTFELASIPLRVNDWRELVGRNFAFERNTTDASIYLGEAHNPVDIHHIEFKNLADLRFEIACVLFCDFEFENVAENIVVPLTTTVEFKGLEIYRGLFPTPPLTSEQIVTAIRNYVELDAYLLEPTVREYHVFLPPNPNGLST
jgi:hypothetical protein